MICQVSYPRYDLTTTRRTVIASAAFVPLTALTAVAQTANTVLSAGQLRTLEALVDRVIPKDELGPGAVECGVATYIDRALAGALAPEKNAFVAGLAGVEALGGGFADLPPEKRDELLVSMDINRDPFFARVRRLTLEGMFGDPYYGGNRNFAGWDLIRYPGPRLAVAPEDQKMTAPPKPYRRSAWGAGR